MGLSNGDSDPSMRHGTVINDCSIGTCHQELAGLTAAISLELWATREHTYLSCYTGTSRFSKAGKITEGLASSTTDSVAYVRMSPKTFGRKSSLSLWLRVK